MYFRRNFGSFSVVCRTGRAAGSFTCSPPSFQEHFSGIALGADGVLFTVVTRAPANTSFVQVRTATTLAVVDEIELPGTVTGGCTALTPTCIGGVPVVGCVDTAGRLVFVATDTRGVDPSADWPMEGHDPRRTLNSATALSSFSCQ